MAKKPAPASASDLFAPKTSSEKSPTVIQVEIQKDDKLFASLAQLASAHRDFKAAETLMESLKETKAKARKHALEEVIKANCEAKTKKFTSACLVSTDEKEPFALRFTFTTGYKGTVANTVISKLKGFFAPLGKLFKTKETIVIPNEGIEPEVWGKFVLDLFELQKKHGIKPTVAAETSPDKELQNEMFKNLTVGQILEVDEVLPTPTQMASAE